MQGVISLVCLFVVAGYCAPPEDERVRVSGGNSAPTFLQPGYPSNQYQVSSYEPTVSPDPQAASAYNVPEVYGKTPTYTSIVRKDKVPERSESKYPTFKSSLDVPLAPVVTKLSIQNKDEPQWATTKSDRDGPKVVPKYKLEEKARPQWAILRSNLDNNFNGNFQYDFETENGIAVSAIGSTKEFAPKKFGQVITGSYSYTSPEGVVITTYYTADENGFVVQGDHLPVAPALPELPPLIAKSVAYIQSQPPLPENQQYEETSTSLKTVN